MGFPIEYEYWGNGNKKMITAECVGVSADGQFVVRYQPSHSNVVEHKKVNPDRYDGRDIHFPEGIPPGMYDLINEYSDEVRVRYDNTDELVDEVEDMTLSEMKDFIDEMGFDVKKSQNKPQLKDDIIQQVRSNGEYVWAQHNDQYEQKFSDVISQFVYNTNIRELADVLNCNNSVLETILRTRAKSPDDYPDIFGDDYEPLWQDDDVELEEVRQRANEQARSSDEGEVSEGSSEETETDTAISEAEAQVNDIIEEGEVELHMYMEVQFIVKIGDGSDAEWVGFDPAGEPVTYREDKKSSITDTPDYGIDGTTKIDDNVYYCIPESAEAIGVDADELIDRVD